MSTAVAGIDWSISGPSVCIHPKNLSWSIDNCKFLTHNSVKKTHGKWFNDRIEVLDLVKVYDFDIERFDKSANKFMSFINKHNTDEVCFEAYSYASNGKVFNLAESTGLMKLKLYQQGINFIGYTPPVFKKYATGKGNAGKPEMFDAFLEDTNLNLCKIFNQDKLRAPVDNLIDSYWICKFMYENSAAAELYKSNH